MYIESSNGFGENPVSRKLVERGSTGGRKCAYRAAHFDNSTVHIQIVYAVPRPVLNVHQVTKCTRAINKIEALILTSDAPT